MNNTGSTITLIDHSTFDAGLAAEKGAALYNKGTIDTIQYSGFINNKAQNTSDGRGGAIYNETGTIKLVDNSSFSNNSAKEGGALYLSSGEIISLQASIFDNNTSTEKGGAIYNNSGTLKSINDVDFTNNQSKDGAAIYNDSGEITKIQNSTFESNTAQNQGGAIYNNSSIKELSGSLFTSNTSLFGGAIYNNAETVISQSSFISNTAGQKGGAIYNKNLLEIISNANETVFENNFDASGKNDIYNDNGSIIFKGSGITRVNSGISGNGAITKIDGGTLVLKGLNSSFNGFTSIESGKITFAKENDQDTYLGGTTNIETNGTLEFELQTEGFVSGTITGTGTFTKTGAASLRFKEDNSAFTGKAVIAQGAFDYDTSDNGTYFNGLTEIKDNAVFNYTNSLNQTGSLNGLATSDTNSGVFNKKGEGTVVLDGDNSAFSGKINIENGTVSFTDNLDDTFVSNLASIIIKDNGVLNFNTASDTFVLEGVIKNQNPQKGLVTKTGSGKLIVRGDNSVYDGKVRVQEGTLRYVQDGTSKWFTGETEILSGAELNFNIDTSDTLGKITGSGSFSKTGSGVLNVNMNTDFTGTVNVNEGKLLYIGNGTGFFTSAKTVIQGIGDTANLEFRANQNNSVFNADVLLNGNAQLTFNADSNNVNIAFAPEVSGADNTASFENGTFIFENSFETFNKTANSSTNKLSFADSTMKISESMTVFGNDKLNAQFENSTIDLSDSSSSHLIFDELNFVQNPANEKNKIIISLELGENKNQSSPSPEHEPSSDKISYNTASGTVELSDIRIVENGEWKDKEFTIFEKTDAAGNTLNVDMAAIIKTATSSGYEYEIKKSSTEGNIVISTVDYNNSQTLKKMHTSDAQVRNFNFDNSTDSPYRVLSNLENMGKGTFNVSGLADTNSIITGSGLWEILSADSTDGNDRNLSINDVTISNAFTNTRTDGSALFAKGSGTNVNISDSAFSNNVSQNKGGAIYNEGAAVTIKNTDFKNNTAQLGGAIYNNGTLNVSADAGRKTEFTDNLANGVKNDIYNDNGVINFSGEGSRILNGGISGDGSITKEDIGTLELKGNNSGFIGNTFINNGKVVYENTDPDSSFFGGVTSITKDESASKNGILEFNLSFDDSTNGNLKGNGTIVKEGAASLNVTGDNTGFDGALMINNGTVKFDNAGSNKYFKGTTAILKTDEKEGVFEYTASNDDVLESTLSGNGTFIKKGGANLALTGDNSSFQGIANIDAGKLTFEKTASSEFLQGTTIINSELDFIASEDAVLKGSVKGTGIFNKSGAQTLSVTGAHKDFTGTLNIKEGTLSFSKETDSDSFFGGTTVISNNAVLQYDTKIDDKLNTIIQGTDAAFEKAGDAKLFINGDNSGFSGNVTVSAGTLSFVKESSNDKFFAGIANIKENAFLEYNLSETEKLEGKIEGSGTFIKSGNSALTILGDNSAFLGKVLVKEGAMNYEKSAGGAYFSGSTQIAGQGILNYTNNEDDVLKDLSGSGLFVKKGTGTLNLTGENKDFKGNAKIENGTLSYTQSTGSFFSGNTDINQNAVLHFTNTSDEKLSTLSGKGKFIKDGEGTLYLSGNNIIFAGDTTVEKGTLYFDKKNHTDLFFSGKTQINTDGTIVLNLEKTEIINGRFTGNGKLVKDGSAAMLLTGDNSGFNGKFELKKGSLNLTGGSVFFNPELFTMNNGTALNMQNNSFDSINLNALSIPDGMADIGIDVDLINSKADFLNADSFSGNGLLNIKNINLMTQSNRQHTQIKILGDKIAQHAVLDPANNRVAGPIYMYDTSYNSQNGMISFKVPKNDYTGFNPGILAAPVAAQIGGYLTQINTYEQAFANMDMVMLLPKPQRDAFLKRNQYASADSNLAFTPTMIPEQEKGGFFRPYTTLENVPLKNGPKVSNVSYGTLFGVDSEVIRLKYGFDGVFSVYGAYNGSTQTYNGVKINQNGGTLGVMGVLYKGNFFTGLTANAGAMVGDASSILGSDTFTMLNAGIASKSGYNWELFNSKFIIQPSYTMSYSFVNTFDNKTKSGISVQSEPLNAIQIAPGIKFIGNLKNGWQPYASVTMVWNVIDKTNFKANDVTLPEMSIKPYVVYGAGVQKRWGERFTGYVQAMLRNGGRNGIGFQLGFRWTI